MAAPPSPPTPRPRLRSVSGSLPEILRPASPASSDLTAPEDSAVGEHEAVDDDWSDGVVAESGEQREIEVLEHVGPHGGDDDHGKVTSEPEVLKTHEIVDPTIEYPSPSATVSADTTGDDPTPQEIDPSTGAVSVTHPPLDTNVQSIGASAIPPPTPVAPNNQSTMERNQSRRRSTIDVRSANRFSGFISNLIHRRPDRELSLAAPAQPATVVENENARNSNKSTPLVSRVPSPVPPRPITPPPSLPPPSLPELGLSLNAITSSLTPSHFNTPPASGTFLEPHYLLLCHAQGLDVLPLVSPPAPQPYALVRRVSFKSVVVMEERGVLVAIAGRREGVRVYALSEVKKAVEWRIDVEVRREKERQRREEAKKGVSGGVDKVFSELRMSEEKEKLLNSKFPSPPASPSPSPSPTPKPKKKKSFVRTGNESPGSSLRPRPPTTRKVRTPPRQATPPAQEINEPPPAYTSSTPPRPWLRNQPSAISVSQSRSRSGSVTTVLAGSTNRRRSTVTNRDADEKRDWMDDHESSDEEAINLATAGPSGSAALDERTSAMAAASNTAGSGTSDNGHAIATLDVPAMPRMPTTTIIPSLSRRNRPAHLDLSRANPPSGTATAPPPSPTPTLITLRQALSSIDPSADDHARSATPDVEEDEDGTPLAEPISFAQALLESRLPDLPPPGSRRPQQPILLSTVGPVEEEIRSPRDSISEGHSARGSQRSRRGRRWSVLGTILAPPSSSDSLRPHPLESQRLSNRPSGSDLREDGTTRTPSMRQRESDILSRSHSQGRSRTPTRTTSRSSNQSTPNPPLSTQATSASSTPTPTTPNSVTPTQRRFFPRIISQAFQARRSEESPMPSRNVSGEVSKRPSGSNLAPQAPPPKLEYVKLPGTKGAVMIKAVETAKKSFLAILCGDAGEKVELFAGTYRTTLGLSRTFILPDSPRTLELQLQGDDLVEVFLVFSQNVFGLEPATVRVREVRVGRAERRAARRRNRENRMEEQTGAEADAIPLGDEETSVSVSVGVALQPSEPNVESTTAVAPTPSAGPVSSQAISRQNSDDNITPAEPAGSATAATNVDDLALLALSSMSPYTTFQQLSFAPQFPLATIADECVIPPTYPNFLQYRAAHEAEENGSSSLDLATVQFSPPGLPLPSTAPPSKWFYRDPKGVVQGPWKASLMQSWYKDGLLPPDLPVRREEDNEYVLLRDLRLQSVDPTHPFRPPPPPLHSSIVPLPLDPVKPLLPPISLLAQPRHYGPPALFFSTRSGHSTAIVDARGRSVLKGRFMWTPDDEDDFLVSKLGDVRRLEAFDVSGRAVLVGIRQGGMEVVDVGDALMKPGDESRTMLPNFNPPQSNTSRRGSFIWRIGSPTSPHPVGSYAGLPHKTIHAPVKKSSIGIGRSPGRPEFPASGGEDIEHRVQDELLFLGRRGDNIYFCERSAGSFRILRLSPTQA
ncbi:hypothetical protein BD410DRAFT_220669 [Rickenella mellea]|uniref:GYF domain-containing protein n=1 Tax=Rickenella mellea TaxID=50990 RepID=A0A4Y7QLY1_9AGAM|nr:hypothetical protein BD410DRAFT_220669 [Rickenella mellea]